MTILYSDDNFLQIMRSPILQYGVSDWINYHSLAASFFEIDLEKNWYRQAAESLGIDWLDNPFDSIKLLQGFNYLSTGTVNIIKDDIVCAKINHTAGGTPGNYYKAVSNLGSIDLEDEDFDTSDWSDVTDLRTKFRYCVSCYALFLVYQYLSQREKDDSYAEQRNYWYARYKEQFNELLRSGISYDFNGDGIIDSTEIIPNYNRYRLKRV